LNWLKYLFELQARIRRAVVLRGSVLSLGSLKEEKIVVFPIWLFFFFFFLL